MGAELSSMLLVSDVKLVRVSVAHETVMNGSAKSTINSTKQSSVFFCHEHKSMLRYVSTQRHVLVLDFLAPALLLPKQHLHSTTRVRNPQAEPITKKPYFPIGPLTFITDLGPNGPQDGSSSSAETEQFNKIVTEIRLALDNSSSKHHQLPGLWEQIGSLRILPLLGRSQLEPLSKLMKRTFVEPSPTKANIWAQEGGSGIHEFTPSIAQNIAIVAARSECWDAMLALMQYHIRKGDALAVLLLYDKFMTLVGDKGSIVDQGLQDLGSEEKYQELPQLQDELLPLEDPSYPPDLGHAHFLMAAVTAYAMKDSFDEALEACLATVVQLDKDQVLAFTDQVLSHDPKLKFKVKKYLLRLILARQLYRPAKFVRYVRHLGANKSTLELSHLYEAIKDGLGTREAFLAADPSLVTPTKKIALTQEVWTTILHAFIKCGEKKMGGRIWADLTKSGITPGTSMWTALLDAYGEIDAVEDALFAWDLMLQEGTKPDALTYRAIINILFKARRPDLAMELFKQYESLPVQDQQQHLRVYNTVLAGLCRSDREEGAEKIRMEMETKGPKPDEVTYNILINHYGIRRKFQKMAAILRTMEAAGFEGNDYTFTTILNALHKAGHKNAADLVLALMEKRGVVQKNVVLYTSLINHQLREGGKDNVVNAMKILASLEKDPRNLPNEITYTAVLCGLHRLGWMDPGELRELETQILDKMRKRGLSLGLPAYHLLLKAYLTGPHEDGVKKALAHYAEMKAQEVPIKAETYYIILAGLQEREEWGFAHKIVEEMYAAGIYPTGSLFRLVNVISNQRTGA